MKFGTLQVFPRQGVLQEYGLEFPSAVVGRGEGSPILIDDFSVGRRHARLTIDSGRLLVEDLGSVSGTYVDGVRLEPGARHLVAEGAALRFGDIEARFLSPAAIEAAPNLAEEPAVETHGPGGLALRLVSPALAVEPGKQVSATVSVTNTGRLVDHIKLEVPDLPADWYTIDNPAMALLPGGRADVVVTLHPPRRHDSVAGEYTFTVRVRSRQYDEHPEADGQFTVLPFEAVALSLEAVRSKRNFRLLAENHGNDVVRYDLTGRDDEQAYRYEFETPAVELQPGQKRIVNLAVRRRRQLFGQPVVMPFEVIGRSHSGAEVSARGQLAITPPLQRLRMPATFAAAAIVLGLTALIVLILSDGTGTRTASAEDPYAGVHLCDDANAKQEQAERNQEAADDKPITGATVVGPTDGGRPIFGEVDRNGAPFFAQNDARWGAEEYARSTELPNGRDWCGTTIEQCGCAMTSVSVMLALYGLLQMPDGQPLSPKALNDWFNGNARKTERGWVSRGYIYGDVIWSAANELSAEIARIKPGAPTVRFVRTGSGSEDEIRAELKAGRPVILEVPGHWIAAVGLDGDTILINDPFYRDRKTLDVYAGKVRSSVHYEPSSDLSAVVITAPADVKFKVTDKQGRVVATGEGALDAPTNQVNQIPGASLSTKKAWRDPTCIEKAPPPDAGTNQIVLPGNRDDYTIEIISTGGQPGSVAIHTYGRDGTSSIATIEGQEGTKAEVDYDPNKAKPDISIVNGGAPATTVTPTPPGGGSGGGPEDTPEPGSPTPLPIPTATQTPFIEQRTSMTLPAEPGQTRVEVATNSGFELGDPIRFAPGLPNEEDNIIVGFGSFILATPLKFAHSPGEPILRLPRPPGQGPGLPPGVTPPPETGPLEPPSAIQMQCSTIYQPSPKLATYICDAVVTGAYTTTRWSVNGRVVNEFTGSPSLIMTFPGDTPAVVSLTVCNVTLCRSSTRNDRIEFPPGLGGTTQTGGGTTGSGGGPAPSPTPAGNQVTVTCTTEFPITPDGQVAQFTCTANFAGDFTGISWSAPGGSPPSQSGNKKTFVTSVRNDPGSPVSLKISATVCNFGICRSSQPVEAGISRTITILDSSPATEVNQGHRLTLMARVQGLPQPGSKAIPITPQGGTVQFMADGFPIGPSATLFTVGSVAVAQVAVETNELQTTVPPDESGLPHLFVAVYSGGINAFGSSSDDGDAEPRKITVKPPLPDGCDSVNNDGNTDSDPELEDNVTDGTCRFATPKDLGGGTVLNTLSISGPTAVQDGASNAVIVGPGDPISISASAGRTEYCPGCIRQVYIGIGGYDPPQGSVTPMPSATRLGPSCANLFILPLTPAGTPFAMNFNAPQAPGVYYLRATTTLDYFCVGTQVGPPENSVGRIIVRQPITAAVELWDWSGCPSPATQSECLWAPLPGTHAPVTGLEEGQRILLRARVPEGATGRVTFTTTPSNVLKVNGAVPVAEVCPASGEIDVPNSSNDIACTPWEARVLTDPVSAPGATTCPTAALDPDPPICVIATYSDPNPLIVPDPADTTSPFDTNTYQIRFPANPPSNTVALRVLATARVNVSASPNPVDMGSVLTLSADVVSADSALNLKATGGTVQFKTGGVAGGRNLGSPVPVDANGHAEIRWHVGVNPPSCNPACAGGGSPFDTHDENDRDLYDDVYAVYTTGGDSPLMNACNPGTTAQVPTGPNCPLVNVDIDAAPSTVAISSVTPSSPSAGQSIAIEATVTGVTNFSPAGGIVEFSVSGGPETSDNGVLGQATVAESPAGSGVFKATLNFTTGAAGDQMDTPASYVLSARFLGTSALDESTSAGFNVTLGKESATVAVTLPGGSTISAGANASARVAVSASNTNDIDNNSATISLFNGATSLATHNLTQAEAGVFNFSLSALAPGTYSLRATYSGNNFYAAAESAPSDCSTGCVTLTVNPATASITLDNLTRTTDVAPTGSNSIGDQFSIRARVNYNTSPSPAGGTVTLKAGTTTLATHTFVTADNGEHVFNLTTASGTLATTATTSLTIEYSGNTNISAGTLATPVTLTLVKANPTVTVTATDTTIGGQTTVTVTVSAPAGISAACDSPANCLEVRVGNASGYSITTTTVQSPSNVIAVTTGGSTGTCLDAVTPSGSSCTIYAGYLGNNLVATGNDTDTFTISRVTPTVTVTGATVTIGNQATVSATVTAGTFSTDCTGCVTFRLGSATGTAIGTAQNVSGGTASITITTGSGSFASAQTYTIFAVYSGNTNVAGGNDSDSLVVDPAPTTLTATGAQTGGAGSSVTLTAAITSAFGTANDIDPGTVQFFINGVAQGSPQNVNNGQAQLTGVTLSPGTYQVTATYTGGGNYAGSSDTTNFAITVT